MARNRVHSQVQAAYVGPAPATGFHFITSAGVLNDNFTDPSGLNLIQQLDRVQSIGYDESFDPEQVIQLGTRGFVDRPLIKPPEVELSFDYYIKGIANEAKLGFDVNYEFNDGLYYTPRVCPISGFYNRQLKRIAKPDPFQIFTHKDFRNMFFVVGDEYIDVRTNESDSANQLATFRTFDPKAPNYEVIGFGNCYINSYGIRAEVGDFPTASVSYVCENIQYTTSGSGITAPAVDKKYASNLNRHVVIPRTVYDGGPTILKPGDITLTLSGNGQLYDAGLDFNDAKIQNFNLDMQFDREQLRSLGWKLPLDRQINFPVLATLTTDLILGDGVSGNLMNAFTGYNNYNLQIKMLNNSGCVTDPRPAFLIDVFQAKLRTASFKS